MSIKRFLINTNKKSITIDLIGGDTACLPFEYLRVFTPMIKQKVLVSHKKHVILTAIENVGKHGYRLIFDDKHSAIYSTEHIIILINEHTQRWQHYLAELKASGHTREAIIGITQL